MSPTIRQKKAFKDVTENNRPISVAMRSAGYTASTATRPKTLTDTKGWKELMDEYMPDSDLAKVHKEGLNASVSKRVGDEEIIEPDYNARHKYLDTAYKLKGSYAPERRVNVNVDIGLTDDEIKLAEQFIEQQRNTISRQDNGSDSNIVGEETQDKE